MYRIRMNEGFVVTLGCAPDSDRDLMNSAIHVREVTAENSGAIPTKANVISADVNGGEAILLTHFCTVPPPLLPKHNRIEWTQDSGQEGTNAEGGRRGASYSPIPTVFSAQKAPDWTG